MGMLVKYNLVGTLLMAHKSGHMLKIPYEWMYKYRKQFYFEHAMQGNITLAISYIVIHVLC